MVMQAQQNVTPPPDLDPFVGQWRANAGKSRPALSKKQATYTRTIRRDGVDLVFVSSGGPSKALIRDFRIRCDGAFHPLPTGHVLSCIYIAPDRVEGETNGPDGSHFYWTREVSADRQVMTISEYKDRRRAKLRSVMVLDRIN